MRRAERACRIAILAGLLLLLAVPFLARKAEARGIVEVHARMAVAGGWMPGFILAQAGVPLHLRLTSDDVTHGFAIGQSDRPAVDVLPGKMTDLTLTFDKPGTYTFYCTRWCGPDHWRMRGTIQVNGSSPQVPQPVLAPLYTRLGADIDAPHPAPALPASPPSVSRGAALANRLPGSVLSPDYVLSHSPAQAFQELRADPRLASLTEADLWDAVAYLWETHIPGGDTAEGKKLYSQNCAACHGETGGGDGVFAPDVKALAGKSPANLADPGSMLGASPAVLQGKILRGGMGTGMPAWGPVLTELQTWDLVSYLYSFPFEEMQK